MADIIFVVSLIDLALLFVFLIFSFIIQKLRKPLTIFGILFLIIGEGTYILGRVNSNLSFDSVRFLFTLVGYFLLLFGFKGILKGVKKK